MAEIPRAARALKRPTQKEIADRLGVSQQAVSAWLRGEYLPERKHREKLEEFFGIPASDWEVSASASGEHQAVASRESESPGGEEPPREGRSRKRSSAA